MKVIQLQSLSRNRIRVFTDESESFVLYKADVSKCFGKGFELKEETDIPKDAYETIIRDLLPKRAKLRAMNILIKNDKTEHDLRQKLAEGFYPESIIDQAIEYVKSFGYIDDSRYAANYAAYRMESMSRRKIECELLKHGIESRIIDEALDELYSTEEFDECAVIKRLAEKKCGTDINAYIKADEKNRNRLIRYLMGKGYSYENIKHSLDITSEVI